MKIYTLEQQQTLPITQEEAWAFFSSPANLEEITPDDVGFEITSKLSYGSLRTAFRPLWCTGPCRFRAAQIGMDFQ